MVSLDVNLTCHNYCAIICPFFYFQDLFGVSMILPLILSHSRDLGTSPTLTGIFGKILLTLKAPIMTAADDTFCNIFSNFRTK